MTDRYREMIEREQLTKRQNMTGGTNRQEVGRQTDTETKTERKKKRSILQIFNDPWKKGWIVSVWLLVPATKQLCRGRA